MSHNKVHNPQGNVPFSWENKPGESKITTPKDWPPPAAAIEYFSEKLPPPPCPPDMSCAAARASNFHDLQLPLPPCPFQQPPRSSSRRGLIARKKDEDDPFLTAYRECTKNNYSSSRKGDVGFGWKMKSMSFIFSCKQSCSVVDDSMIRISKLPKSKSERESSIIP